MREIKFRGKDHRTGGWIYGFFVKAYQCLIHEGDIGDIFVVEPNTVGQFTGLLDKNGKEIYEGDVVKAHDIYIKPGEPFHEFTGKVEFGNASFVINQDDCMKHYRWLYYECEIIGNIYENPELLKEATL